MMWMRPLSHFTSRAVTRAGFSCPPQMNDWTVSTVTLTEISLPLTVSYVRPLRVGRTESATTWYVRMEVSFGMSLRRAESCETECK